MSVEKINELKVRIFDLNEELAGRAKFESQFFGELAQLLGIPEESQREPGAYIDAIVALKEKVPAPVEGEVL